jgi:hypothetical protein
MSNWYIWRKAGVLACVNVLVIRWHMNVKHCHKSLYEEVSIMLACATAVCNEVKSKNAERE